MNPKSNATKWTPEDYKDCRRFFNWRPRTPFIFKSSEAEKNVLHTLKQTFGPLPPYKQLEQQAIEQETLVSLEVPIPDGMIAFLENTAEQCTSPQTKHSEAGMQGARHWVQRVDTPEGMFKRLTDGYGISLMFGERCHQFIRNSNNWRGSSGCILDIDDWRKTVTPGSIEERIEHLLEKEGTPVELKTKIKEKKFKDALIAEIDAHLDASKMVVNAAINNFIKPDPLYSMQELFDRYPLIPRLCTFLLPSASSLHEGRPFKARGIVLFPEPLTDQRLYRQFGQRLCDQLDCIPANVTKNPVAVGFGNTHHAQDAWRAAA